jgi:hypothetical protein
MLANFEIFSEFPGDFVRIRIAGIIKKSLRKFKRDAEGSRE